MGASFLRLDDGSMVGNGNQEGALLDGGRERREEGMQGALRPGSFHSERRLEIAAVSSLSRATKNAAKIETGQWKAKLMVPSEEWHDRTEEHTRRGATR